MATNLPKNFTNKEIAQFDSVATEIRNVFNPLIAELIARRDNLLKYLSNLKSDYADKEMIRITAIGEIENAQQHMHQLSLKVNANISVHKDATDVYSKRLQELKTPTKLPHPYFNYPRLEELQKFITEFGEISETEMIKSTLSPISSLPSQTYVGRLTLTVSHARLNKSYSRFIMDPYCKLNISNTDYETVCAVNDGKDPKWDGLFHVALLNNSTGLDLEIFDRRSFASDLRIAQAHIEIPARVFDGELVEEWFPLDGKLGEGKEAYTRIENTYQTPTSGIQLPQTRRTKTLIREFGEISESENVLNNDKPQNEETISSLVSCNTQPKQTKDPNHIGRLSVTIIEARLNKSYGRFRMNLYCRLTIDIPTAVFYREFVKEWYPSDGKLGEGKEGTILTMLSSNSHSSIHGHVHL
ncbi:Toll-interacting protein B-like [Oopsacas minuta]|uniref:Toll-interacting protein B-like n=1 Tax=Oopsacas minuta TaxID=111878 RepID=A0AAV7JPW3_9METZ|nr:Toll-interacting protein B-like [Oopsacas minuta]